MRRSITDINDSIDLATLFNEWLLAAPGQTEPINWEEVPILDVSGKVLGYDIDMDAWTDTRCVLADGHAAVELKNEWHVCPLFNTMVEISRPHWCPVVYDSTAWDGGEAIVTWDWRSVYVGQGGYSDTIIYATAAEAASHYEEEVRLMERAIAEAEAEEAKYRDEDDR